MAQLRISAWGIKNPIPVAILFIGLTIAGLLGYASLPIKKYPNISFPLAVVSVTENGAAPSEMETQITRPVENAIAGVANVKHLISTVSLGASQTSIEFELGTDMQKATDDVRTAVERVRVNLPVGIDPPTVQRIDVDSAPILTYAVSSPKMSPADVSWFVDDTVSRAIQAEKGVAQVARVGGVDREISVVLDPSRMAALGVTAPQVNDGLRLFNVDSPGGRADVGAREQTVRVLGSALTVEALRNTTIPMSSGRYVTLSQVAEIGAGPAEVRGFARLNGRPAVAFQVNKTRDSSDVSTEAAVIKVIAKLARENPDVTFTKVVSTVDDTRESYDATVHVLLEGMGLASLVVLLFLRNWRATAITALAMPLSLLPTLFGMKLMGFSLNVVTLLSLTLVIGILVDDAIVEIENIEKRIERGMSPFRAALTGADSIGLAVVATTATIVAVFVPVSFMKGVIGQYFREFGFTVAISVLFSLLVARLLTPLLAAYLLKPSRQTKPAPELPAFYRRSFDWALRHKWLSALFGGAVFLVSGFLLVAVLPKGFVPIEDPGYFYIQMQGPPGSTRVDMDRAADRVTKLLLSKPDVQSVFAQVGSFSGSGGDLTTGTVTVVLKHDRKLKTDPFKRMIRPQMRGIPDIRLSTLGGFGGADVQIFLASEDIPALDAAQFRVETQMRGLREVSDVRPAPAPPGPELVIRPKAAEAARLGVTSEAIASVIRVATIGDIDPNVAKFSEGVRRIPIRVRLPEPDRADLSVLGNLQVPVAGGGSTPLRSVADLSFEAGPAKITRFGRQRQVSVDADLNGVSLGQALTAIKNLPAVQHLPSSVKQPAVGNAEMMADLMGGFGGAMLTGVALIYAVLVLLFRSFFKPAIILAALPLTFVGAVIALLLARSELDLPVLIGLLMLLGIAAKNSILLVEFAIEDERAGQSRWEALHNAARERARPIVMTTVAMAAGMLPTALGLGQGSEFRQPMAIAVIGGLISSTVLSLVLVPVVYEFVDNIERWISPRLSRLTTPKGPGDEHIDPDEETLVTHGTPAE